MKPERLNDLKTTPIQMWLDKDRVELLAALEETEHLLTDHGPNGRNYTNDQYVTLRLELDSSTKMINRLEKELAEAQQQKLKYKTEAERLNEICKQLAGEEMLFQDGEYETEMQRLWNRSVELQHQLTGKTEDLAEARQQLVSKALELTQAEQTIARQREGLDFYANQEHWELPSFGRGQSKVTSDRGSKARELLKEGSDKA